MPTAVDVDLLAPLVAARGGGFGLPLRALPAPDGEPGWRPSPASGTDDTLRADLLRRAAAATGTDEPRVVATWVLESHAWYVAALALGAVLVHGRVPPLDAIWLRDSPEGMVAGLAVPPDGWQPADGEQLAERLAAHLAPLVEALAPHRARRPLWRSVGDRLGQAAHWCGDATGDLERAWSVAGAALAAPTPLQAPARFELRDGAPFRRRTGCCLSYRAAEAVCCEDCARTRP